MDKVKILAVDPSLRSTGVCFICGDVVKSMSVATLPSDDLGTVLLEVFCSVRSWITEHSVHIGAVEGFSYGSKGNAVVDQGAVGGAVRLAFMMCGVPYVEIAPASWKAVTLGNGKIKGYKKTVAGKRDFLEFVKKVFGVSFLSLDACEAFLIGKALQTAMRTPESRCTKSVRVIKDKVVMGNERFTRN